MWPHRRATGTGVQMHSAESYGVWLCVPKIKQVQLICDHLWKVKSNQICNLYIFFRCRFCQYIEFAHWRMNRGRKGVGRANLSARNISQLEMTDNNKCQVVKFPISWQRKDWQCFRWSFKPLEKKNFKPLSMLLLHWNVCLWTTNLYIKILIILAAKVWK